MEKLDRTEKGAVIGTGGGAVVGGVMGGTLSFAATELFLPASVADETKPPGGGWVYKPIDQDPFPDYGTEPVLFKTNA